MVNKLFHITIGIFLILISSSFWAQKTLEFRVSVVETTVDDMDALADGDSDPLWYFRMEDLTYGNIGLDSIRKPETNCSGITTENYSFFSEMYSCNLPDEYQFTWGGYEEDFPGADANSGTDVFIIPSIAINPNQTSWTFLVNRSVQVAGLTCTGTLVTWSITVEYRVLGSFVQPVHANFSLDAPVGCSLPHTVFFTDLSTNPDTWFWDFGDAGTSMAQNPIHSYTTTGVFPVTLTITDTVLGCSDVFRDTVIVSIPEAYFTGSPLLGCAPLVSSFTDTSKSLVSPILFWDWDFGDGNVSSIQNPSNTFNNPGIYTIILRVMDSVGCIGVLFKSSYVEAIGPTVSYLKSKSTACVDEMLSFTDATIPDAPITGWNWDFGDGNTSTNQNPTHAYSDTGKYIITLTVNDLDGCSRSYQDSVRIFGGRINFTLSDSLACVPSSVFTFNNLSTGSYTSWTWYFGDGNTANTFNTTHQYLASSDSVMLYGLDTNIGCVDSLTKFIKVYELYANYTINGLVFNNPTICYNSSIDAQGIPINTYPPVQSFYWDFGDGTTSTSQNNIHFFSPGGGFYSGFYVEIDSIGCRDTLYFNVTVHEPRTSFTEDINSGCDSLTVVFTDGSSFKDVSPGVNVTPNVWDWDFGDGNSSSLKNPTHKYTSPGIYDVRLSAGINAPVACFDTTYSVIYIYESRDTIFYDTICANEYYIMPLGDTIFTGQGTYFNSLNTLELCDSIIQVELFAYPISSDTIYDTICANDSIQLVNGSWVNASGIYKDTLSKAITGCDSIITVFLHVKDTNHIPVYDTICENSSYTLPKGAVVNTSGTYRDTLQNVLGCDSIITTFLTVNDTSHVTVNDTFCQGDSYTLPGGGTVSMGGTYINTIPKQSTGCDSVITTILVEDTVTVTEVYDTICKDQYYVLPSGITVNNSGTYFDIIPKQSTGCDSIVITYLVVNDTSVVDVYDTMCQGQSYTLPKGGLVTISGTYRDTLPKDFTNCDSIVITHLYVIPTILVVIDTSFCEGDSLFYNGTYYKNSGTYYDTLLSNATGCDSVIQLNITTSPRYTRSESIILCQGDSVFLEGAWQTTPGTYYDSLLTNKGCDSIITTIVNVQNTSYNKVYDTICQGDSLFVGGANQGLPGNYFDTLINSNGCDSILETELYVSVKPIFTLSPDTLITIGDQVQLQVTPGYTYQWSPTTGLSCFSCPNPIATPLVTTTYTLTVSIGSCDSIAIVTVMVQEEAEIFVPTIFSPNGDQNNDLFRIRGGIFTDYRMIIYDRWGEKVFETDNYKEGWDGTFRGKECLKGAYGFIIKGVDQRGRDFEKKGNITLIR